MYDVTHLGLTTDLLNLLDYILRIRVTRQSSINVCIVLSISISFSLSSLSPSPSSSSSFNCPKNTRCLRFVPSPQRADFHSVKGAHALIISLIAHKGLSRLSYWCCVIAIFCFVAIPAARLLLTENPGLPRFNKIANPSSSTSLPWAVAHQYFRSRRNSYS